jgi:hypothetical protein
MKVFICWSGDRSQAFAAILKDWLQDLMPRRIEASLSVDIRKGTLWFQELDRALDGARLGIVCLTEEGARSPWIHYEAGILSRALREAHRADAEQAEGPQLFPVLFDIAGTKLSGPLAAYQSTSARNRDDMWRFVQSVARRVEVRPETVRGRFDAGWDTFLTRLDSVKRAPILEILPDIEELFRGKAFAEPLEQQLTQDWLERYDEIRLVHGRLREKLAAVKSACRPFVADLFSELTAEVEAYGRDLSPLIGRPRYPTDAHGRVILEQPGIGYACEARRNRVLTLSAQLVDNRQAAVFDGAFRFSTARSTEVRKKLVHLEAAALRRRLDADAPDDAERLAWLDSDWDFDHILFFELLRDRPLRSFGLKDAFRHAVKEFERVRFRASDTRPSLMALYYSLDGIRRMLRPPGKRLERALQAEARTLIVEMLAFLAQPGLGPNAPVRTALRDIAEAFGLRALADEIVRSAGPARESQLPPTSPPPAARSGARAAAAAAH